MGLEPTTKRTTNAYSNQLSYNRHLGVQKYTTEGILQNRKQKKGREFKFSFPLFISEQSNNELPLCSNQLHSKMHPHNQDAYFETLNNRHAPTHLNR